MMPINPSALTDPNSIFVIAGPCVVESKEICIEIATHLKDVCKKLNLVYIFKASYEKANRTSYKSFSGLGLDEGLEVLRTVRDVVGVPILTDVHDVSQVGPASRIVDILQVPAFLSKQTELLTACGSSNLWVNIKKGQFMSPWEAIVATEKIRATGNNKILLSERGTFFGYERLVNDFTAIPIMMKTGCPVVFDITHSMQTRLDGGRVASGTPQYAPTLARAAVAAGANGLFIECHPKPTTAQCDAATMLELKTIRPLLEQCSAIAKLRGQWPVIS